MSALSLEEVKHDIQEVGWEECPVGSILAIKPAALDAVDNLNLMQTGQKKRRGKANRSRTNEISNLQTSVAEEDANKDVIEL
jgi:hypothetical protein